MGWSPDKGRERWTPIAKDQKHRYSIKGHERIRIAREEKEAREAAMAERRTARDEARQRKNPLTWLDEAQVQLLKYEVACAGYKLREFGKFYLAVAAANFVNYRAKQLFAAGQLQRRDDLYAIKYRLVQYIGEHHPEAIYDPSQDRPARLGRWVRDPETGKSREVMEEVTLGILYVETAIGQLSFHFPTNVLDLQKIKRRGPVVFRPELNQKDAPYVLEKFALLEKLRPNTSIDDVVAKALKRGPKAPSEVKLSTKARRRLLEEKRNEQVRKNIREK